MHMKNLGVKYDDEEASSVLEEGGISYRLPDHVCAEESSRW
jgi:hypothetical protein